MKASIWMIVAITLISASSLRAQFGVGTWVQTAPMKGFTMSVENCCNGGRRVIFHVTLGEKQQTVTVDSRFDGSDAPVLYDGKPNGESMGLKRIDDLRTSKPSTDGIGSLIVSVRERPDRSLVSERQRESADAPAKQDQVIAVLKVAAGRV